MAGSYDFEEQERLAELKAWWEDNRWYVLGAAVAAVVAIGGYRGWQYWGARQAEDAAAMYTPLAAAAKGKDARKTGEAAQALIDKHPRSFYASEAALVAAKAAFDAGQLDEAARRLEWVKGHGAEVHRSIARIRLAAVRLEQKRYDDALKVLDGVQDEAFAALASDLRGDIMLAQGRLDEARSAYRSAAEKALRGHPVKGIAETKLNALGGGAK